MDDCMIKDRSQVLLLGNGINYAYGGESWDELMKSIRRNPNISSDVQLSSPMPLQAVISTGDHVDSVLKEKGKEFYGCVKDSDQRKLLNDLLMAGFDHILTTNYSYELECAAFDRESVSDYLLKKHLRVTSGNDVKKAESKYMLHTYYEAVKDGVVNKIWHIHGESRKPDSMILGHYYYGLLLDKYIQLLKKREDKYLKYQQAGKIYPIYSWLDAFISGDVYILGFGYNLSEFDLWWLLNRKKREKANVGKVHFYEMKKAGDCKNQSEQKNCHIDERLELLRLMDVEIHDMGMIENDNYKLFYQMAVEDITRRVKKSS